MALGFVVAPEAACIQLLMTPCSAIEGIQEDMIRKLHQAHVTIPLALEMAGRLVLPAVDLGEAGEGGDSARLTILSLDLDLAISSDHLISRRNPLQPRRRHSIKR